MGPNAPLKYILDFFQLTYVELEMFGNGSLTFYTNPKTEKIQRQINEKKKICLNKVNIFH